MCASLNQSQVEYSCFRVMRNDVPTGLMIRAETTQDALRKLAVASDRTDLCYDSVSLELAS
jgi:hypothetical protein